VILGRDFGRGGSSDRILPDARGSTRFESRNPVYAIQPLRPGRTAAIAGPGCHRWPAVRAEHRASNGSGQTEERLRPRRAHQPGAERISKLHSAEPGELSSVIEPGATSV